VRYLIQPNLLEVDQLTSCSPSAAVMREGVPCGKATGELLSEYGGDARRGDLWGSAEVAAIG
jgi:hypothetical protein